LALRAIEPQPDLTEAVLVRDQQPVEHALWDRACQEVEDHYPLIVPADDPLHLLEEVVSFEPWTVAPDPVDYPIVEFGEKQVQLRDEGILVVARIAD
jgi:hypothetical protein